MELDEVRPLRDDLPVHEALGALANLDPDPNPTARAVQARYPESPGWTATAKVPFSSARKWSGAEFDDHGGWVLAPPTSSCRPAPRVRRGRGARRHRPAGARPVPGRLAARPPDDLGTVEAAAVVVLRQRIRPDAASKEGGGRGGKRGGGRGAKEQKGGGERRKKRRGARGR
ncbi:hypothetical protein GCM10018952_15000 [Streptosporangium vulgare]